MSSSFDDVLAANARFAEESPPTYVPPGAAAGLAVVMCIDSRIEPLRMLGLVPGDAKILRNAGARVTEDVLRSLVIATHLLGVDRVMVIAHTDCRLTAGSDEEVATAIRAASGMDVGDLDFLVVTDVEATLVADLERARSLPLLGHVQFGGFVYDVETGRLRPVC